MNHVLSALNERLRRLFGDRLVVLAGGTRLAKRAHELYTLGARHTLVLDTDDHAPLHDSEIARWVSLGIKGGFVAVEQRRLGKLLTRPGAEVRAILSDFDAKSEAVVISTPYNEIGTFEGRPVLNARRHEWVELENKTTIDALWDELSARRAPAMVFDLDFERLWGASEILDAARASSGPVTARRSTAARTSCAACGRTRRPRRPSTCSPPSATRSASCRSWKAFR